MVLDLKRGMRIFSIIHPSYIVHIHKVSNKNQRNENANIIYAFYGTMVKRVECCLWNNSNGLIFRIKSTLFFVLWVYIFGDYAIPICVVEWTNIHDEIILLSIHFSNRNAINFWKRTNSTEIVDRTTGCKRLIKSLFRCFFFLISFFP